MQVALLLLGLIARGLATGSKAPPSTGPCSVAPETLNTEVTIRYECLSGFIPAGGATSSSCTASGSNGVFAPEAGLECVQPCAAPPTIENASIDNSEPELNVPSANRVVTYVCNSGFVQTGGNSERTCTNGGAYSGTDIVCTPVCAAPPTIPNASIDDSEPELNVPSANRVVTYVCNSGFIQTGGDKTRTCTNGGAYSGQDIVCRRACGTPPTFPNARLDSVSPSGLQLNQKAVYECNKGFVLQGKANTAVCKNGGPFIGKVVCIKVCPRNLKHDGVKVKYANGGFVAYFSCVNRRAWIPPAKRTYFAKCIKGVWVNGPKLVHRPYKHPVCELRRYH